LLYGIIMIVYAQIMHSYDAAFLPKHKRVSSGHFEHCPTTHCRISITQTTAEQQTSVTTFLVCHLPIPNSVIARNTSRLYHHDAITLHNVPNTTHHGRNLWT
jgi:hypothetical protein